MATNDKYDRQLRLWGAQGQRALGETKVVAVGTSAAGTETLKNLILPGIGAFCVMDFVGADDANAVTDRDAASNFFLPQQQDAASPTKAEAACHYLRELNPDVSGSHQNLSLSAEEDNHGGPARPAFWTRVLEEEQASNPKLLVIASDLVPSILEALAEACHGSGRSLLVVSSYGLIGCVRLQLPPRGHPILQPKPTNAPPDLRLVTSFPAFGEYAASLKLEEMDSQEHGHVPYPVLLAKAMRDYQNAKAAPTTDNDAAAGDSSSSNQQTKILPKTFAEKQDFVDNYVKAMARDLDKELNFQEAVSNAYLAYTERELDWFHDPMPAEGSKLGQLRKALGVFLEQVSRPPLNGSVPDMTASTSLYVRLQQLYKDQGESDLERMTGILRQQQQERMEVFEGDGSSGDYEEVTDEDIRNFCANVYAVGHLQTRSLREEYHGTSSSSSDGGDQEAAAAPDDELVEDWKMALMDPYEVPVHTPLLWYLGFRACQIFCQTKGRYPGCVVACGEGETTNLEALEEDATALLEILEGTVLPGYRLRDGAAETNEEETNEEEEQLLGTTNLSKICRELTRYGNAEVHTVASVVGGVASQEAVKIITGQYVPLNNTYVYNGIVSVGGVYKF